MKKFLVSLFCAAMVCGFTACGGNNEPADMETDDITIEEEDDELAEDLNDFFSGDEEENAAYMTVERLQEISTALDNATDLAGMKATDLIDKYFDGDVSGANMDENGNVSFYKFTAEGHDNPFSEDYMKITVWVDDQGLYNGTSKEGLS
ncbi:MAG: hypothetical protein IKI88_05695 [Anaerotignum sp.]|nr:hypothetical protein [Anaerotignum sp.]